MLRRDLLKGALALPALGLLPRPAAAIAFRPSPGAWRAYEVRTRVEIAGPEGPTRVWLPLPGIAEPDWCRVLGNSWRTDAPEAGLHRDPDSGALMLAAAWPAGTAVAAVEATSRVALRDRAFDPSGPGAALDPAERARATAATALIPTDGIVRETAMEIVAGARGDLDKARAIYDWVVEQTFRDPATRGCGVGDIASMLRSGHLGGKCADLNALYVGLARAAGLPARDIYGIRVAPSRFGYRSLGASAEVVTKAQHCRADVWIEGRGWVPVDPADVRKVALEEPPGNLPLADPKVGAAREALFGAWEGNWMPYNTAHDVRLPGARAGALGYLMYPQAETGEGLLDPLDPDHFRYVITARAIEARP